jgi:hypothetical protein
MAATVTLASTTLTAKVCPNDASLPLASTAGIVPGLRLYLADSVASRGELCAVVSLGLGTAVNVRRGVDGTASAAHAAGATVTIGRADQFYGSDPVGMPPVAVAVSPWINVLTGTQWLAQGDEVGAGTALRFWQQVTTTTTPGVLGARVTTQTPIS